MNIWWIRRDLRLADNQALTASLESGSGVLPVFILDDSLLARPSEFRQDFLFAGLRTLEQDLRRRGSGLVVRRGDPVEELRRLASECDVSRVFAEEDFSPYARRRDKSVAACLDLHLVQRSSVHPPYAVQRADGNPYTVFTPFSRAWKALPLSSYFSPAPDQLPKIPPIPSVELPDARGPVYFPAGEQEAAKRLGAFLDGSIYEYGSGRDRLDLQGTSGLSPYLRFGMISARRTAAAARQAALSAPDATSRAGCERWLNELIWREFYQSILFHFPGVLREAFKPSMRNIPWRTAPEELKAWQGGMTGYPIVDAGMRQLAVTGWMHNRARMITASFLVKDLLINWQEGESWFMRMLVDGDPASNNGGWQWIAGTGTDAAPYFRIFNPILQSKKFNPQGRYIRRWVPELVHVADKFIHTPWEMPQEEQRKAGVIIGQDYPAPIVEHGFARERVLSAYAKK